MLPLVRKNDFFVQGVTMNKMKVLPFLFYLVLIVGLTASSAIAATDTSNQDKNNKSAHPKWRCDEPVYNFGKVWSGEKVKNTYIFHNDGDAPLRILNVRAGCRCTATKDYDRVIEPGKQGKLPVILNTKGYRHPITKTIRVTTNDPHNRHVLLKLKGDVKPLVDIKPNIINFGRINQGTELTQNVFITNNTDQKMNLTPLEGKKDVFSWKVEELEPGKKAKLIVTANKPFQDGPNNTRILLKTGLSKDPRINLFCQLIKPPLIECTPPVIWTRSKIEKTYTRSILVRFNGQGVMKLESVKPDHPGVETSIETVSQDSAYRIKVSLPEGLIIDPDNPIQLVIKTNVDKKPRVEIPIKARPTRQAHTNHLGNKSRELIGNKAPHVELSTPDSKKLTIGQTNGKVQLLNFWTPTCLHAQEELQNIELLAAQLREDKNLASKVQLINISLNTFRPAEEIAKIANQITNLPLALDPKHQAAAKYKIKRSPTVFLVSPKGIIESVHQGYRFGMTEDLKKEIQLLAQGKTNEDFGSYSPRSGQYCPLVPPIHKQDDAGPRLTLETQQYYIGWIQPGEKQTVNAYYRNDGNKPLQIKLIDGTNNLKVNSFTKSIKPNEVGNVKCTLIAPPDTGVFSTRMEFDTDDHQRPKQLLRVMAMVKPLVTYMPPNGINFGRDSFDEPVVAQAALSYHGSGTIHYTGAKCDSQNFEARVKTFGNSTQALLEVTAKPPLKQGMHKTQVGIKTDNPKIPLVKIPVRLYKPDPIEVIPKKLTLSKKSRPQRRLILITNNRNQQLDILDVKTTNDSIHPHISASPNGESFRVSVTFDANFDCKDHEEKVLIMTNDKQQSKIEVPIRMRSAQSD